MSPLAKAVTIWPISSRPSGGHAHQTHGAHGQEGQGQVVVAAVELEAAGPRPPAGRRREVAGGVLHAHDVGHGPGQAQHGLVGDLAARAHRDVVEHDRQPGAVGHGGEMVGQALLGRTAVVGRHHQDGVDPGLGGRPGELDGMSGVVGPGAGDDRNGDGLGHRPPQVGTLVVGQHRSLTGGPGHDQAVAAVGDQPAGQGDGTVDVEGAGVVERRHHGRHDGSETTGSRDRCHGARLPGDGRRAAARRRTGPGGPDQATASEPVACMTSYSSPVSAQSSNCDRRRAR